MKKSKLLLVISTILLLLIGINILYINYIQSHLMRDMQLTTAINGVHAAVQRTVKMELADMPSDDLMDGVEVRLEELRVACAPHLRDLTCRTVSDELQAHWSTLRQSLLRYRELPSDAFRRQILQDSEDFWTDAEHATAVVQLLTRQQTLHFRFILFLLTIDMVLLLFILYFLKIYVQDNLEFYSNHDPLTRACNRHYLFQYLQNLLKKQTVCCIIMLDIDDFKAVNDTFGHDAGDFVLKKLVNTIQMLLDENNIIARFGGEEFVVVLQDNLEMAQTYAEAICNAIAWSDFGLGRPVTVSLGVSAYVPGEPIDHTIKRADVALYNSKTSGKNRFSVQM